MRQAMNEWINIISALKKYKSKCYKPGRKQGRLLLAGLIRNVWVNCQSWELRGGWYFGGGKSLSKQTSGKLRSI